MRLAEMFIDLWDLVFPNCCAACHAALVRGEHHICTQCRLDLPLTQHWLSPEDNALFNRLINQVHLRQAYAFLHFAKGGKVQQLMHQLKYHNAPEIGLALGRWFAGEIGPERLHADALIPVPLHSKKKHQRGYNQKRGDCQGVI
ncbi:MAG: ComF family protein [Synechococcaceae cyanobacterium SM2_3_60]|nr:ComF family protein [Synechococcaceae cyanobacterium SM2_3_60]